MKLVSRFLCHYITSGFPVRQSVDDRIGYRITSWCTHQEHVAGHA